MISYKRIYKASDAELISQKKTRIISIILLAFAGLIYGCGTSSLGDRADPSYLAVFIYFTALVPLFSCCVSVFKDMHDIPSADVSMSMPLSGIERYFSKILTIVRAWLVPFLISAAGAFLLSAIFGGSHYYYSFDERMTYDRSYHPEVMMKYNLQMFLWFMAAVLFIISVTAVCQCCIGAKAESRYLPVMLMTALSIFVPAVYAFITDHFADVSLSDYFDDYSSLFYVWTFSAIFAEFDSLKNVLLMILNCLISAGVIISGAFICRKRDARTVGRPIVFKLFFEIIMAVTLTLFFLIMHVGSGNLVVLFLGWLGSIILRIVVSRKNFSFSKIGVWTGMFAVYYVLFLVFMYIAFITGGFGAIYKTPSADAYDGSNVIIGIDIDEIGLDGYFSDHCSAKLEKSLRNSGRDEVMSFVDSVSKTAAKQNRLPGIFTYEMFGGKRNYYRCAVSVNLRDGENNYSSRIYRISFYVSDSGRHDIVELTKSLGGEFTVY
ncbi:hypothetical protein [Huintestinicola sp.]